MKFLLDTHILLWWLADDRRLSEQAKILIASAANQLFVSAASAWEISIKTALGKLKVPSDLKEAIQINNFEILPINLSHAFLAGKLQAHHADPFDRMLVAQAKIEDLALITHDKQLKKYELKIIFI